jgi:hypothetical protein
MDDELGVDVTSWPVPDLVDCVADVSQLVNGHLQRMLVKTHPVAPVSIRTARASPNSKNISGAS